MPGDYKWVFGEISQRSKYVEFHFLLKNHNTTFVSGEPQVCYDMLGNATVPQSAPHVQLHSATTQPQFDMLGNPIGDSSPEPEQQQQQQPAVNENTINGINIVGVVNTESTENQPEEKQGKKIDDFSQEIWTSKFLLKNWK